MPKTKNVLYYNDAWTEFCKLEFADNFYQFLLLRFYKLELDKLGAFSPTRDLHHVLNIQTKTKIPLIGLL